MTAELWIRLLGFSIGAFLHVYLTYVIARHGLRGIKKGALFSLVISLGIWHLGNALSVFVTLLGVLGSDRISRIFESAAYAGLALLPACLLVTYRIFYREAAGRQNRARSAVRLADALLFLPLLFLPFALWQLLVRPEASVVNRLQEYLYPFITWFAVSLLLSAQLSLRMAGLSEEAPEKRLMTWLARIFVAIAAGMVLIYVFGLRNWPTVGGYLETLQMLSSILPTSLVAYHIYRYNYLELVIRQSLVYALMIAVFLTVYFIGIRQLSLILELRYRLPTVFTESLLVSALVALSFPISAWLNRFVNRRVRTYRDFVVRLNDQANAILDLPARVAFIEGAVHQTFGFRCVYLLAFQEATANGTRPDIDQQLLTSAATGLNPEYVDQLVARLPSYEKEVFRTDMRTPPELLSTMRILGVNFLFVLRYEKHCVGLLLVDSHPLTDLGDVEDLLLALSGQIAGSLVNGRLLDAKLRLEREVARQERLAHLGRMAATMAHEVKNPLSSVKTLVQLMLEDKYLWESHGQDLQLINEEIDRLNRTVSQLLSFARPLAHDGSGGYRREAVYVQDLIKTTASAMAKGEPAGRLEFLMEDMEECPPISTDPALLQEILINLFLNALQASKDCCRIQVVCRLIAWPANPNRQGILLKVSDDGMGIPISIQANIFDAFFTTKQRGTGLGLFVVKRNVEALGGILSFRSPVCETGGTAFEIVLPYAPNAEST